MCKGYEDAPPEDYGVTKGRCGVMMLWPEDFKGISAMNNMIRDHIYGERNLGMAGQVNCLKGIQFIVLYPPKCSHDLPPLAGLYTQKPFQSPEGYSRAASSI